MNLTLQIINHSGESLSQSSGIDRVTLVHLSAYEEGDKIVLETDSPGCNLVVHLEDSMIPAFVYLGGSRHTMTIPFGEKRDGHSPKSFTGEKHLLQARCATIHEIEAYKNVAINPFDCHESFCLFPHATANVETRGETQFAARNAIDGTCVNQSHGLWPYHSWGINQDPAAELRVGLGRIVLLDKAVIFSRADFPHDAWWTEGTLEFSDGSTVTFPLAKTDQPQTVEFAPRKAEWVVLKKLIKCDAPSPYPALSQIELWGTEVIS